MTSPEYKFGEWYRIGSAPWNKTVLLWWRPITENRFAEATVVGQVVAPDEPLSEDSKPTRWWNGQRGEYQDIWHVTHWMPLPPPPGASMNISNEAGSDAVSLIAPTSPPPVTRGIKD
jgi:hypothetical protein